MKFIVLLLLTACAGLSDGEYRKKFHLEDHKSPKTPLEVHKFLTQKMEKCYPQKEFPSYQKTIVNFKPEKNMGSIFYEIDIQGMGKGTQTLLIVDVVKDPQGSLVKVYSKGDVFHPAGVYKHHIQKWLDGKTVDCHAQGQI